MCGHCDMEGYDYCGDKRDERISNLVRQVKELSFLVMKLCVKLDQKVVKKAKKKATKRSKR